MLVATRKEIHGRVGLQQMSKKEKKRVHIDRDRNQSGLPLHHYEIDEENLEQLARHHDHMSHPPYCSAGICNEIPLIMKNHTSSEIPPGMKLGCFWRFGMSTKAQKTEQKLGDGVAGFCISVGTEDSSRSRALGTNTGLAMPQEVFCLAGRTSPGILRSPKRPKYARPPHFTMIRRPKQMSGRVD